MAVNRSIEESIMDFVRRHSGDCGAPEALAGDASMRRYFRVHTPAGRYIVCLDATLAEAPPAGHQFMLVHSLLERHGVPVPGIVATDPALGLLLLDDLGDTLLEDRFPGLSPDDAEKLYAEILEILAKIQSIPPDSSPVPFGRSFDMEKLMFEFDFFIEHAVKNYFSFRAPESFFRDLRGEFVKISEALQRPEFFVLNHRDFHSRNIMLSGGKPFVIDFQDARMGLPQYDLASLLRDSYLRLDEALYTRLAERYFLLARERAVHAMSRGDFDRLFDLSAFQRNVKAVGTFAYQSRVLGRRRYEPNIESTLSYLGAYAARRGELSRAYALVGECTGGAA